MNIGSLIRGLLGDQKAGETKILDMKPGQVVRGVVMNVSEDGTEAVVQIQGVPVKAKLETPLQAGQTATLQVQPPGEEGTMVLKPIGHSSNQTLTPSSMVEVLEFASLPDTKENREMIRAMGNIGIPLTKENITQFKEMMAMKPAQVPLTEWMEASAIAFHRGLPMSAESVKGLHQAVFGPGLHTLLQSLENQLRDTVLGSESTTAQLGKNTGATNVAEEAARQAGSGNNPQLAGDAARGGQQALLTKLQSLLSQLRGELAQQAPWASASQPLAQGPAGAAMPPAAGQAAVPNGSAANSAPPPLAQASQTGEGAAGPSPKPPTQVAEPWVGRLLKLLGAEHEQQVLRGGAKLPAQSSAAGQAASSSTAVASQQAEGEGSSLGSGSGAGANRAAEGSQTASAAVTVQAANVAVSNGNERAGGLQAAQVDQRGAQEAGISQGVINRADQAAQTPQSATSTAPPHAPTMNSTQNTNTAMNMTALGNSATAQTEAKPPFNAAAASSSSAEVKDTLKGLLLQIAASSDLPPALKEAAGQLIQHMTGQQLLLNTDRTAPFAQVTMFIPLHGTDGEQTASVHIQSRRGRKGELDATNCRLWFDLDMKHIGPTVIDVHVVDRIVSLNLRNDQPWVSQIFESRKSELAAGVESIGYQLLSMRTSPFPEVSESGLDTPLAGSTASEYTPQAYRGVDYKI